MRRVALALLAVLVLLGFVRGLDAQTPIDVRENSARSDFPNGVAFTLDASLGAPPDEVRLVYRIAPDGVRASAVADCVGGAAVTCNYLLGASLRNFLIPGAEITYSWRVTTGDAVQETPDRLVTYEDSRFDWKTLSENGITVWYYDSDESDARAVLDAARETVDGIGSLVQATVGFPIKVFFYGSAQDMQQAILSDNAEGVITLGEVVYSDTAMVAADAVPLDITRHEVAHIVVRQAVREPYEVPDWLNEGTAVFAQERPLDNQESALDRAIQRNEVFSVRSISSASAGSQNDTVSLFYGQSWSLVDFLVSTYGEEKFADLFRAFASGDTTAEALEAVYGFNQDGLENEWRASVGLPPREAPTPGDGANVPTQAVDQPDTSSGSDDDGGAPVGVIVAVVALTLVLAGGLAVGGLIISRRFG